MIGSGTGPTEKNRRGVKGLREIMHSIVSVGPDAPAREALKLLLENNVSGVPVVDEKGNLEGFISDRHLLASALPRYLHMMDNLSFVPEGAKSWVHYLTGAAEKPVREVMSRRVPRIELGKSEIAAAHKMLREEVSNVVVTEGGKPVGIVNRLDLYAAIEGIEPPDRSRTAA